MCACQTSKPAPPWTISRGDDVLEPVFSSLLDRVVALISRIIEHLRGGTLLRAVLVKLGLANWEVADPDHYRGDTARNYLSKRLKQEMWHKEQALMDELISAQPDGISVLDVPFGSGRFVEMFRRKNMSIFGIDISQDMLDLAKQELGDAYDHCQIEVGSADALPYDDNSFDLVVCFRFIGLLPYATARKVLAEIRRVCRGAVIIRVPVRKPSAPPTPPIQDEDLVQGRLLPQEVDSLFSEHGFRISETRLIAERDEVSFVIYVLA